MIAGREDKCNRRARLVGDLSLETILRETIEAGGDTDTVASMAGQIVGAWIGASQISRNIIESLPDAMDIERIANEFAATVETVARQFVGSQPE